MTLTCRPPGRGNWAPVIIEIKGPNAVFETFFLRFRVGQIIELGEGRFKLRIAAITP